MEQQDDGFQVFKGLQKPLEFMGIRGRFLIFAAITVGISFFGYIGGSVLLGQLAGFIVMFIMIAVGLITIYIKQKQGLHNKKRNRGIYIYKNILKNE